MFVSVQGFGVYRGAARGFFENLQKSRALLCTIFLLYASYYRSPQSDFPCPTRCIFSSWQKPKGRRPAVAAAITSPGNVFYSNNTTMTLTGIHKIISHYIYRFIYFLRILRTHCLYCVRYNNVDLVRESRRPAASPVSRSIPNIVSNTPVFPDATGMVSFIFLFFSICRFLDGFFFLLFYFFHFFFFIFRL